MKTSTRKRIAKAALLLAIVFWANSPAPAAMYQFEGFPAVSSGQLDTMRGGFHTRSGLQISLGITKAVMIDGVLQTMNTLNIQNLARLQGLESGFTATGLLPETVTLVRNSGFNTLIQNSLNQKNIQSLTIIDSTVTNAGLFRQINLMSRINEQLIGAMH